MNNKQLARKLRRQARRLHRRGDLSQRDYETCMAAANSEAALTEINLQIKLAGLNPWETPEGLSGVGWKDIFKRLWDWFKENWPAILAIIIKFAPLLLLAEDYERARNEDS